MRLRMNWVRVEVSASGFAGVRSVGFGVLTVCLGIYAPGYAERRAQRIKDAYGIDVPVSSTPAQ